MDNTAHNDELLVRYLDGQLSGAEQRGIEQQLAADKILQEQYDSLLLTREAIRQYGLQQQVAAIHKLMMPDMQAPVKQVRGRKKMFRLVSAIAAAVVLFIAGYWFLSPAGVSANKVFAAHYHTFELSTVRGDTAETTIEKLYKDKNYSAVLKAARESTAMSAETYFLTGSAAMELKDDATAIDYFNKLIQLNKTSPEPAYNDQAEYYLALAYLRSGAANSASAILSRIKYDLSHTYYNQVTDEFIEQVKKLSK